jgi:integrase/recombinase XerD
VKRPDPIRLSPFRATPRRYSEAERKWYWQVRYEGRSGATAWTGYGTTTEITRVLAELVILADPKRDEPTGSGTVDTVTDLLETWLASSVDVRKETGAIAGTTATAYEQAIRHLKRGLGTVQLYALDQRILDQYDLDRIRGKGAPGTVFLERIVLGAAWRWGLTQGIVPNRALPRTSIRPQPREKYVPSRAEVAAVLKHARGWHLVALRLQGATGARASEIGHLRIGDVDLEDGIVRITKSKTEAREVPIAPVVVDIVRRWVEEARQRLPATAPLLSDVPPLHTAPTLNNTLRKACKAAGLPRWSTHALRYRAVIDMIDAGVDPKTACEITGHSLQTMLGVYRTVTSSGKRTAIKLAQLGYLPEEPGQVVAFKPKGRR